jgi:PDZ domain-containing protein
VKAIPLWVKLLGAIGILAAVCVGLAYVPTGDVAYAPNAPISLDGKIQVDGRAVEPLQGQLYLVGVTERRVNLLERLLLDVSDPDIDFGPAPAGTATNGGPAPADVRSMSEAKQVAAGVAFDLVSGPHTVWVGSGAVVEQVENGTPAAATLRAGDLILQVDGTGVDTSVEAERLINAHQPGTVVTLGIQRAGVPLRPRLRTLRPEQGDEDRRSRIGATLSTTGLKVRLPRNVAIDSGDVVGPSAGLAFALYLYDALSSIDLMQGRYVVVTGALAPDGQVLPVGRVRQKAIAAQAAHRDLLLVPLANADEARAAIAKACHTKSSCVEVVPVRSAMDAVRLLSLSPSALTARIARTGGDSSRTVPGA